MHATTRVKTVNKDSSVALDNYNLNQAAETSSGGGIYMNNVLQHLEGRSKKVAAPPSGSYVPALVRSRAMETILKKKRKSKRNAVGLDLKQLFETYQGKESPMFSVIVNANSTGARNTAQQHATHNSSSQGTQRSLRSRSNKRGGKSTPNRRLLDSAKSGNRSKIIKGESSVQ